MQGKKTKSFRQIACIQQDHSCIAVYICVCVWCKDNYYADIEFSGKGFYFQLSHMHSQSNSYCPLQYALYKKHQEAFNLLYEDYFGKKYHKRLEGNAADKIMMERLGTGS